MPKRLTSEQVEQYRRDGFTFPVPVYTADEVARYRASLEAFETAQGGPLDGAQRAKSYLLFDWAFEMITHPNVLDAVEDVIGPNILAFYCTAWLKPADDRAFVSWHQDSTYFGLEPAEQVAAWLALSASAPRNGCVRILPGSHTGGQFPVRYQVDDDNLLTSGQNTDFAIDESSAVDITLLPGELSLHHTHAVHGSNPNHSGHRRLGFCISYIPTHVFQTGECRSPAILVRGVDEFGHFAPEMPPTGNADATSRAEHARSLALFRANAREKGNRTVDRLD